MGEQRRDKPPGDTGSGGRYDGPATLERITAAWQETSEALRDTERRYRELVEYSLGLICTHDLTGTLLSINPAAANSLGYRPQDGIGRNLREFLAPARRHLFDEYLQRIQKEGHDTGLMRLVTRDGDERVWMYRNVLSHGLRDIYVLGHAIDVTDRVAAERTLRQSEQALRAAQLELEARVKERTVALEDANARLRIEIGEREAAERSRQQALVEQRDTLAFLANFSDRLAPLVTFDDLIEVVQRLPVPFLADWTMVHVVRDDGAVHFAPGVRVDRAREPRLPTAGLPTGTLDGFSHVREVVAAGRIAIVTLDPEDMAASLVGSGGPVSALEQIGTGTAAMLPLIVDGRVRAVLSLVSTRAQRFTVDSLVVEDVARRIQLALDRIQLYREAHEANRLKDDFLGTLSHELRTPLNAIFGWARILRGKDLDPATTHAVEVIERNAEAQVRLIDEVLDVSRIIKGKMTFVMEPLDLAAILRATIDTVRPAMSAKRIRFEAQIDRLPPVAGDSHRLQQVFWNLLSNALKFTGSEGAISVRLTGTSSSVELAIADTGVGIRRDVLPFVFDRFRQADSSTTRTYGGLGLGLAIVKYIVELHGGTVHAASAGEGHGATFTIQLPVAEGASARRATLSADHDRAVPATLDGRTILVVEDHDDARELIVGVLEAAGARVLAASTTADAIVAVTAQRPDLLVADLGLPGEDGYVLLTRIRAMYPEVPALALTAYARATDRERVLAAGFEQHIVKPVDPAALLQAIVALL